MNYAFIALHEVRHSATMHWVYNMCILFIYGYLLLLHFIFSKANYDFITVNEIINSVSMQFIMFMLLLHFISWKMNYAFIAVNEILHSAIMHWIIMSIYILLVQFIYSKMNYAFIAMDEISHSAIMHWVYLIQLFVDSGYLNGISVVLIKTAQYVCRRRIYTSLPVHTITTFACIYLNDHTVSFVYRTTICAFMFDYSIVICFTSLHVCACFMESYLNQYVRRWSASVKYDSFCFFAFQYFGKGLILVFHTGVIEYFVILLKTDATILMIFDKL